MRDERGDDPLDEHLGGGRARGDADAPAPVNQEVDLGLVLDQVGPRAVALGDLDEATRVRGVRGADDEEQIALPGERLDGVLAVRVA